MPIEPLSTIISWVLGISFIIFIPLCLILLIIFFIKCIKEV